MKKLSFLLALVASVLAMASLQAGSNPSTTDISPARDLRTCRALLQKMERSASMNTWRNRVRSWKCRDDLSPVSSESIAASREARR